MSTKFDHTKVDNTTHMPDFVVALQECGAVALRRVKNEGEPNEYADAQVYLRCDSERMTFSLRLFGQDKGEPVLEIAWYCFDENGVATYETENCWSEIYQIPLIPNQPAYVDEEWMMARCVTAHNIWKNNNASIFTEYREKQVVMLRRAARAIKNGQKTDKDGFFDPYIKMLEKELV